MNEERKHIEFIDENAEEKANRRGALRDFLDGSILIKNFMVKQLPYILFLTLIAVIYIANRYHAEKVSGSGQTHAGGIRYWMRPPAVHSGGGPHFSLYIGI